MPTNSVSEAYAEWLASPPVQGLLIETLEMSGAAINTSLFLCNRKQGYLQATDEQGVPRIYTPISFTMSKPGVRNSTELTSNIQIDGLGGGMLQLFSKIRSDELRSSVFVNVRLYIDPIMVSRPVWRFPLRFRAETVKVGIDMVEMECVGSRLPNKRAGLYYGLDKYVGLRPY